jgi:hypothetical protein
MASEPAGLSAPHTAAGKLQRAALDVLRAHEAGGDLPTSDRFVYYELKQSGYPLVHHAVRADGADVIDAITVLREIGAVPWGWLADETRDAEIGSRARTFAEAVFTALGGCRISPWQPGPPPVIITETRGVRAALRPVAERYGASITSTNGQAAGHLHNVVAPLTDAPGIHVAYFGDYNPAGTQIEEHTRAVLERAAGGPLAWERLAVTREQARAEQIPQLRVTDKRDGSEHISYEAEALGQGYLARTLSAWLDARLPAPLPPFLERERDGAAAVRAALAQAGLGYGP